MLPWPATRLYKSHDDIFLVFHATAQRPMGMQSRNWYVTAQECQQLIQNSNLKFTIFVCILYEMIVCVH